MIREFHNISLRERNSFHVDVQAKHLIEFESAEDLRHIFASPMERWMVLSGGNNTLFTKDFDGTILSPADRTITPSHEKGNCSIIKVGAAVEWDELVEWAVEHNLWGIENLSLIPGKAGAAPIQNIGAYGCEACEVITGVELLNVDDLTSRWLSAAECEFGYRDSIFKRELRGKVIITAIEITLSREPNPQLDYGDLRREVELRGEPSLHNIRQAVCSIRRSKLPDTAELGNAGSFFKNPTVSTSIAQGLKERYPEMPTYPIAASEMVKLAAGWMIDRAGMKGLRIGPVGVHDKQALVLVNHGGASGKEIIDLAHHLQRGVKELFGVDIEMEVNVI